MTAIHWTLLATFGISAAANCLFVLQAFASGGSQDPAEVRGSPTRAVLYSFTVAMSPLKKESARRHVPTYAMGLAFHAGVFSSFVWLAIHFFEIAASPAIARSSGVFLLASSSVGVVLFAKRIVKPELRSFSTLDDYASNVLVTGFQAVTAWSLFDARFVPVSLAYAAVLFVYIPLGKLRHAIFFPLARVHLGLFYGRRGVWGARKEQPRETRSR